MNVTLKRFAWLEMDHPLGIWHFFLLSKLFYFHVRRRKPLFRQGWHWWYDIKKLFLLNQVWKFNFLAGNFEIVKLLCLHVRRRKPLFRHGWHFMIWHKNETFFSMIFFSFLKKVIFGGKLRNSQTTLYFRIGRRKPLPMRGD